MRNRFRKSAVSALFAGAVVASSFTGVSAQQKTPEVQGDMLVVESLSKSEAAKQMKAKFDQEIKEKGKLIHGFSKEERYIIYFNEDAPEKFKENFMKGHRVEHTNEKYNVAVVSGVNKKAAEALVNNPHIRKVEADEILKPSATYNGPFDSRTDFVFKDRGHNASDAYERGFSGRGVKIAVLDSGIDKDNPYLQHALKGGWETTLGDDDAFGWDDTTGHGTSVAGAIAAKDDNGKPYGVAPDVDLYAIDVTDRADGDTTHGVISQAIGIAIKNDMDIINVSFTPARNNEYLWDLTSELEAKGKVVVWGGGNSAEYTSTTWEEAGWKNIYAVSSINSSNEQTTRHAYGEGIDFTTLGEGTPIVRNNGGLSTASGTSFATPLMAGLIALHASEHPNARIDDIVEEMKEDRKPIIKTTVTADKAYYEPITASELASHAHIDMGYRMSISSYGKYVHGQTAYLYLIVGDESKGVIDNYPVVGATVTHQMQRLMDDGTYFTYKTINGTTNSSGRFDASQLITTTFPKGTWKIVTTISHPNAPTEKITTPFTIQ